MKKIIKLMICAVILAALFSVTALAADSSIKVQLNGNPVAFTDAVPQVRSERTFLPFRAVFNALGFEDEKITYDAATKTVKAEREDLTVSLVLGEKKITVIRDGVTSVMDTDVAAYADYNLSRTFVPVRFISEAVGCNVGWDQDDQTVIIDDLDALFAFSGSTYTIMDKVIAYSSAYNSGAYAMDADCLVKLDVDIDDVSVTVKVDGDANVLFDGSKEDMTMDLSISGSASAYDETLDIADILEMSGIPESIDMDMRMDMEKGTVAFKSNALSAALDVSDTNTWYLLDLSEIFDELGISWEDIAATQSSAELTSFEDALKLVFSIIPLDDKDVTACDILPVIDSIFADSAFSKKGSDYVSEFTVNEDGVSVKLSVTAAINGDKATGYEISIAVTDTESDVSLALDSGMRGDSVFVKADLSAEDMLSLIVDMTAKVSASSEKPTGTYPDGAKVIDLYDMVYAIG